MSAVAEAVLAADDAGISVVPAAEDGTKRPITAWAAFQRQRPGRELLVRWYVDERRTGIFAICGAVSGGLECLDFDNIVVYRAFLAAAEAVGLGGVVGRIRAGYEERSPDDGRHLPYRCSEVGGNQKLAERPRPDGLRDVLIEVRGEGGGVIIAPSNGLVHPSHEPYVLLSGGLGSIATITPAERREVLALARSFCEKPVEAPRAQAPRSQGRGNRPGDLFNARSAWPDLLEGWGWAWVYRRGETDYWRRPGKPDGISATTNHAGSDLLWVFSTSTPFQVERSYDRFGAYAVMEHGGDLAAAGRELWRRGYRPPDATPTDNDPGDDGASEAFNLTDLGNAKRLVARHGADLRYCHAWRKWLVWDGVRWRVDDTGEVVRKAKATVQAIYAEAAQAGDEEARKAVAKHGARSEAEPRIEAMVALAESEPGIPVRSDDLDRDPWLLACANGVLDLRTGTLRPGRRDDLMTKLAPVAYQPNAGCPDFLAFLDRIMADSAELIAFLGRAFGYALTGSTRERAVFFLHGIGRNGKSTLLETFHGILGDYAGRAPTDVLLARRDAGIPNDVAALRGVRFVVTSEADEGRRLDEAKVKDLTGGDTITARFMRGEWFAFRPQFKVFLGTNHKPIIRGTDHAIWDRIRLIPFSVRIPDDEQDKQLGEKLLAEGPGILAWAVRGCLAWQRQGLGEPAAVREATAGYRGEMDVVGAFLEDRCAEQEGSTVTAQALYAAYQKWCEAGGEKPMTQTAMGKRLTERGFESFRAANAGRARCWRGIGLREDPQQAGFGEDAG